MTEEVNAEVLSKFTEQVSYIRCPEVSCRVPPAYIRHQRTALNFLFPLLSTTDNVARLRCPVCKSLEKICVLEVSNW